MSGSTGSGGLTTGDEGPLFCSSNDDLPPFCWIGEKSGGLAGLVGVFGC